MDIQTAINQRKNYLQSRVQHYQALYHDCTGQDERRMHYSMISRLLTRIQEVEEIEALLQLYTPTK